MEPSLLLEQSGAGGAELRWCLAGPKLFSALCQIVSWHCGAVAALTEVVLRRGTAEVAMLASGEVWRPQSNTYQTVTRNQLDLLDRGMGENDNWAR